MNTITDELKVLITLCDLLHQVNSLHDFIGKDDIDSRLRWAAQNTANKINRLSNLNG